MASPAALSAGRVVRTLLLLVPSERPFVHLALVSSASTRAHARLTVRSAARALPDAQVLVMDLDGSYRPVGGERVIRAGDVVPERELRRRAVLSGPRAVAGSLEPELVAALPGRPVLLVRPGVLLLDRPTSILDAAERCGLGVLIRVTGPVPDDDRSPTAAQVGEASRLNAAMIAVTRADEALLTRWRELTRPDPDGTAADPQTEADGDRTLDRLAETVPTATVDDPATLLTAWNLHRDHRIDGEGDRLLLDGRPVRAVDLSGLDPDQPWLLDCSVPGDPRARLSERPALAGVVNRAARTMREERQQQPGSGAWDLTRTAAGIPVHDQLRAVYRSALRRTSGDPVTPPTAASPDADPWLGAPDPFDPGQVDRFWSWLTDVAPDGGPGRYLRSIHAGRADLRSTFPDVPGRDTEGLLRWAHRHGRHEEAYSTELIDRSLPERLRTAEGDAGLRRRTPESRTPRHHGGRRPGRRRPSGVNVIGYLTGELGIGESARLMIEALRGADVPHAAVPVDRHLASRRTSATAPVTTTDAVFDTSLICVNADLTAEVAATVPDVLAGTHRIGMWYWEVEDFPATQHHGFDVVDEVWVATDFVRDAIAPRSPVPVRVVTPPLPQRGAEPSRTRADLGLPDAPLFLFSFDYLSTAERKNPVGLVEAFTRAFAPDEGPVLVIKSINADRRPGEAERLRLRAATRPDVLLLEDYLDASDRDALVAHCDCYVSLHRSEGLGLTMAEAMSWGKPVIATGYSGNLQFMSEQNSFLVPWEPVAIPTGAKPYPVGGTWADPDLDVAAELMRAVIERPRDAQAVGDRAATDIATLHSAAVAGRRVAQALATSAADRTAGRRRLALPTDLLTGARGAIRRLRPR